MIEVQGCISELNFGYNTKMGGYMNSSSDIPKLGEPLGRSKRYASNIYGRIGLFF